MRFLLISRFAELSGYTDKAVRRKIQDGVWMESQEYFKAPDGHILIDLEGFERWVLGGAVTPTYRGPKRGS